MNASLRQVTHVQLNIPVTATFTPISISRTQSGAC